MHFIGTSCDRHGKKKIPYCVMTALRYKMTMALGSTVTQTRWTSLPQVQTAGGQASSFSSTGMCGGEIKAAIVSLFLWWPRLVFCLSSCQLAVSAETHCHSVCHRGSSCQDAGECCWSLFCYGEEDVREESVFNCNSADEDAHVTWFGVWSLNVLPCETLIRLYGHKYST